MFEEYCTNGRLCKVPPVDWRRGAFLLRRSAFAGVAKADSEGTPERLRRGHEKTRGEAEKQDEHAREAQTLTAHQRQR